MTLRNSGFAVLISAVCLMTGTAGAAAAVSRADYERLREWRFSGSLSLPAAGITMPESMLG